MKTPNIVFVNVDQMHRDALSAYGQKSAKTPALDRLAAEGYSFMKAYTTMPQCVAARTSWMTGRMSKEHGAPTNAFGLDPTIPDLGQWLRAGGYDCFHCGKWHVNNRAVNESFHELARGVAPGGLGTNMDPEVTRTAVSFFRTYQGAKPFFLTLGLLNPHDCCFLFGEGPKKQGFGEKIKDELPPLPPNFDWKIARIKDPEWTETDWRYYLWGYYRLCESVDAQIGRIYEELRHSRFAQDTLFLLTADHGDGAGYHGKVSKGFLYDESWRVPLIAAWPGVIPAGVRDEEHLSTGVDIPATICDYAGVKPLPRMTIGRSFRPLFEKQKPAWHEYVVGETRIGALRTAIRDATHKSIIYQDGAIVFDMQNDPLEQKDLFGTEAGKAVLRKHVGYFQDYVKRIDLYRGEAILFGSKRMGEAAKRATAQQIGEYVTWYDAIREGKFDKIMNGSKKNEGILKPGSAGED